MKKLIIALLLLATVYSCKKEKEKQFSTWYVNGHKFSTNEVRLDVGKAIYILSTNTFGIDSNGFQIVINTGGVHTMHWLDCATDMCFKLIYNNSYYTGRLPGTVSTIYNTNGTHSFKLNETWFYNTYTPDEDSILVKGVFSEP
ncbi:MAG TPA: hypothetical protein VFL76_02145 [Edaphocola sp.]|nr:hypothetical protein [Edaphocola sp.]